MKIEELTTDSFQKKVANLNNDPAMWDYFGDNPCIVLFFTAWCTPCKVLIERLEELAKTYENSFYIYMVNIEKNRQIAVSFNVQTVPCLLYCPLKQEPQTAFGLFSKEEITDMIDNVLLY